MIAACIVTGGLLLFLAGALRVAGEADDLTEGHLRQLKGGAKPESEFPSGSSR